MARKKARRPSDVVAIGLFDLARSIALLAKAIDTANRIEMQTLVEIQSVEAQLPTCADCGRKHP